MSIGLYTLHEEQIASRGVSLFVQELQQDGPLGGIQFFDDLLASDAKDRFTNTGTPAKQAVAGGVWRLSNSATDNQYVHLILDDVCALDKKTAFEIRLKRSSVSAGAGSLFAGFANDGAYSATAGPLGDSTTHDLVVEGVGIEIDADADPDAASLAICGSDNSKLTKGSQAIVADTFIRLGFVFDPSNGAFFYVDGVKQSDFHISANITDSTKAPASSSLMDLVVSIKSDAASSGNTSDIDWIAFAQAAS